MFGKSMGGLCGLLVLFNQVLPWAKEYCYMGVVFLIGNSLHIAITARSLKFISSDERRQVSGADEVYVHVDLNDFRAANVAVNNSFLLHCDELK
jgi:hypothetical protein